MRHAVNKTNNYNIATSFPFLGTRIRSQYCFAEVNGGNTCSQILSDPEIPPRSDGNKTELMVILTFARMDDIITKFNITEEKPE